MRKGRSFGNVSSGNGTKHARASVEKESWVILCDENISRFDRGMEEGEGLLSSIPFSTKQDMERCLDGRGKNLVIQIRLPLIEARRAQGWSQQELADLLGTTRHSISRWEQGHTKPGPFFLTRLYRIYSKQPPIDMLQLIISLCSGFFLVKENFPDLAVLIEEKACLEQKP